jgi:predicted RNase H-like HicB family nuclease
VKYLLVLEPGDRNWSAYFPDVPGCVATGRTREQTIQRAREALQLHLAGLREDGLELPEPITTAVEVEAASA